MNQIFIVVAYSNSKQLSLLTKQLQSPESHIFIHIDKKSDLHSFDSCAKKTRNIHFIQNRYNLAWGANGIIYAVLALINEVIRSKIIYSHIHLLSGQDILIKPISELVAFFTEKKDFNYLDYFIFPDNCWKDGGYSRVYRYYLQFDRRSTGKFKSRLYRIMEYGVNDVVVPIFPFLRKRLPLSIKLHGGSTWWSLNKTTVEWLYNFCLSNKTTMRFFKSSFIPDETMFHTILLNSHLKGTIVNDNKRYIDWSRSIKGGPSWLDMNDYQSLVQSGSFFARKVQFPEGKELYNLLPATKIQ